MNSSLDETTYHPILLTSLPEGPWLVIAPHADDETFGMGGTIALASAAGITVDVIVMTDGAQGGNGKNIVATREKEALQATQALGCRNVTFLHHPDRGLHVNKASIINVAEHIRKGKYATVFFPSPLEAHPDHRASTQIAWEALRCQEPHVQRFSYEISSQGPSNLLVDITSVVNKKVETMSLYNSQLAQNAYVNRILALNASRAWSLPPESTHAEAFYRWKSTDQPLSAQLWAIQYIQQSNQALAEIDVRISVIIRTKNRPEMLREAIRSVACQTHTNIELVLVNDGDDNLGALLSQEVTGSITDFQYLKTEEIHGRSHAANLGLRNAKGDFIAFLDDDDWFLPDHFRLLLNKLKEQPSAIAAYSGVDSIRFENGHEVVMHCFNDPFDPLRLAYNNFMPIHSVLFKRNVIERGCQFDERLDMFEDWHFWLQLAQFGNFVHLNEITAKYRIGVESGVGLPGSGHDLQTAMLLFVEASRPIWNPEQLRHICMLAMKTHLNTEELGQQSSYGKARMNEELSQQNADLQARLDELTNSRSWRITLPLRLLVREARTARQLIGHLRQEPVRSLLLKSHRVWREEGSRGLWNRIHGHTRAITKSSYDEWIKRVETPSLPSLMTIKSTLHSMNHKPMISIIMPVYDTPEIYLRECIDSVIAQSYPHWELCIADDKSPNELVRKILSEYEQKDNRIHVVYRQENGHISRASNSALAIATGDFVALLDHDDVLTKHALYFMALAINETPDVQILYSDEDKIDESGVRSNPHFKSDWNPDLFYSQNYVSHLGIYRRDLLNHIGGFRTEVEGSQDQDLLLRCLPHVQEKHIIHVPRVLYHWRMLEGSTALASDEKSYTTKAGIKALNDYFKDNGPQGITIEAGLVANTYRVRWPIPDPAPLVSLLIPTRDKKTITETAVNSIIEKTTYQNYEILILDNGSIEPETLQWFEAIQQKDLRVKVIRYDHPFNYSAINNFGVTCAQGSMIGLINNDIEVISPDWLSEMVSHASRQDIGCVGAKLYYSNDTLQHGGVILGIGGVANHSHKHTNRKSPGYFARLIVPQNLSAVTAACLLVRREVYEQVGGLDEENLKVAFNDVDFCLKVRDAGYRNLWTPYAELYHHESISRGSEDTPEKKKRFLKENEFMQKKWRKILTEDPYYNKNLTKVREDFSISMEKYTN